MVKSDWWMEMRGSLAGLKVAKGLNFKHKRTHAKHGAKQNALNVTGGANATKSNKTCTVGKRAQLSCSRRRKGKEKGRGKYGELVGRRV